MFERWRNKIEGKRGILEKIDLGGGINLIREISNGENMLKIMRGGDEELLDLMSLAPKGTKLNFTGEWSANKSGEGYEITIGNFRNAGSLVLFLHEAGHLQNPEDLDIRSTFKRKYIQETKKDKLNRYPSSRL